MTYLGYDPHALTSLAAALRGGAADLAASRLDRIGPVEVQVLVRGAGEIASRWADFAASVASCEVLEGYTPVHVDGHLSLALALPARWQALGLAVLSDPTTSDSVSAEELMEIGRLLRDRSTGRGPRGLIDDDEVDWLLARIGAWSKDPRLVTALLTGLGRQGIVDLLSSLADASLRTESRWASRVDSATRVGDETTAPLPGDPRGLLLTAVSGAMGMRLGVPGLLDLIGRLDVDAASRVFDGFRLEGTDLATAAFELIERWSAGAWWIDGSTTARNPSDRVLAQVAADPVAAVDFVTRLAEAGPEMHSVVLFGPNDGDVPRRLWLEATSPHHRQPAEVGAAVRDLLDTLRLDPLTATEDMVRFTFDPATRPVLAVDVHARWHEIRGWAGEVTAPWQIYLTGRADEWGWSPTEGVEALRFVADDPRSAAALADGIGRSIHMAVDQLPNSGLDRSWIVEQIGWSIGATDEVLRDAAVDEVVRQRWLWSMLSFGAERGVAVAVGAATGGLASPLPQVVGTVANRATGYLIDRVDGDEDADRIVIEMTGLDRRQAAATALVTVLFGQMLASGRVAAGTAAPPAAARIDHHDPRAADPLIEWLHDTPLPDDVRFELGLAAGSVRSAADRGAAAAG